MLVEKALIPSNSTATIAATGEEHNSESLEDVSDDSVLIPLQDQQALCGVCKQQAGMLSDADPLSTTSTVREQNEARVLSCNISIRRLQDKNGRCSFTGRNETRISEERRITRVCRSHVMSCASCPMTLKSISKQHRAQK